MVHIKKVNNTTETQDINQIKPYLPLIYWCEANIEAIIT